MQRLDEGDHACSAVMVCCDQKASHEFCPTCAQCIVLYVDMDSWYIALLITAQSQSPGKWQ